MFADWRSGSILKPNDFMAFGLFSYSCLVFSEICGGKVTLEIGFNGLAASLIAYCRASFSLRSYMMVLQPPHRGFLQVMFEKLLELIEVLGDVQYLALISKTF